MLLVADIGNTQVKWGVAKDDRLSLGEPFPTHNRTFQDHLNRYWEKIGVPEAVWAANVAGAKTADCVMHWTAKNWGIPVRFIRSKAQGYGVINGYEEPDKLGVDRWASLIALRNSYTLPVCAIDCGTALTLDILDVNGNHLGGLIAPGLTLMRHALTQQTQGIKDINDGAFQNVLGRTTRAGVESGVLHAGVGLIEKAMREIAKELGSMPLLVLSGGDAKIIAAHLDLPYRLEPDLVLKGILIIARNSP